MSKLATYNAKIEPLLRVLAVEAAREGLSFAAIFEVPMPNGQVTLCWAKNGEAKSNPLAFVFALFEGIERQKQTEALARLMSTFDPMNPLVPDPRPVSDETTDEHAALELAEHERRGGSTH